MPAWVSDLPDWTGPQPYAIDRPTAPEPVRRPTPAATPPSAQPGSAAGLAARAELVKRAMQLGLKGSGTNAELIAAIAAKESTLAAGSDPA